MNILSFSFMSFDGEYKNIATSGKGSVHDVKK